MKPLLFGILMIVWSATASAQQWPALNDAPKVKASRTQDVAVIVAVEDYLLLPDVEGAIANANEWELFFQNGLKIPNIHVLSNQNATREEMEKFAKTAAADVGENGTIWWVFIGHGAPSVKGDDGLMVGMDAQQTVDSLGARSMAQSDLLTSLGADTNRTVLIVDACFSGRSPDGKALAAGVQPVIAVDPTKSLGANAVVMTAAKATEVAGQLDGAKRPAFSYLVLGALRGWADDGDGEVTANEALFYARRVLRGAKGRQQTPQVTGNTRLVLSRGVTETEPRAIAEGAEAADCTEGQKRVNGKCVRDEKRRIGSNSDANSKAAMTLEYLQRRITFDKKRPQQGGRELEGSAFYHAIDRPDLAEQWLSHNPWVWVPGILTTIGGVALFAGGIGYGTTVEGQEGWFIGGSLGGTFMTAGGIVMIVLGFTGDKNPMTIGERKAAAAGWNKKQREARGLGPEADWNNPQSRRQLKLRPVVSLQLKTAGIGLSGTW